MFLHFLNHVSNCVWLHPQERQAEAYNSKPLPACLGDVAIHSLKRGLKNDVINKPLLASLGDVAIHSLKRGLKNDVMCPLGYNYSLVVINASDTGQFIIYLYLPVFFLFFSFCHLFLVG